MARAGVLSQIVCGPVLESSSTERGAVDPVPFEREHLGFPGAGQQQQAHRVAGKARVQPIQRRP